MARPKLYIEAETHQHAIEMQEERSLVPVEFKSAHMYWLVDTQLSTETIALILFLTGGDHQQTAILRTGGSVKIVAA